LLPGLDTIRSTKTLNRKRKLPPTFRAYSPKTAEMSIFWYMHVSWAGWCMQVRTKHLAALDYADVSDATHGPLATVRAGS
jgi:hypothetical protein